MTTIVPRIYCVTLPGSPRHDVMKKHLDSFGCQYEFVYGKPLKDAPANKLTLSKLLCDTLKTGDEVAARQAINSYSCRMAMLAANEKFVNDGEPWGLIIQDDVYLYTEWQVFAQWNIKHAVPDYALAVCANSKFPVNGTWQLADKDFTFTETALLVPRQYAIENIEALKHAASVSDYCYWRKYGVSKCYRSPMPFAVYQNTPSYIANLDLPSK